MNAADERSKDQRRLRVAGLCVLAFVLAQAFQELAYDFWIPAAQSPREQLLNYLLPIDQARALLIFGSILLLLVPFAVIALRYVKTAPVVSILGLWFGAAFVGLEIVHRSVDFFVIGMKWVPQFQQAAPAEQDVILHRYAMWNEMIQGWFFPLMLSYLLASCCFAFVTAKERQGWYWLAPIAYSLNALRLLGRMLSTFAGQAWLSDLNDKLYFPVVFVINVLLVLWFYSLARRSSSAPAEV